MFGTIPSDADFDDLPAQIDLGLGREKNERYWAFRDSVYATTETLTPQEVKALALQDENRMRAKIASAVALLDHVEQLTEHGRREPIPGDVKVFVWQRDKGACVQCGSRTSLEFDHVIPL